MNWFNALVRNLKFILFWYDSVRKKIELIKFFQWSDYFLLICGGFGWIIFEVEITLFNEFRYSLIELLALKNKKERIHRLSFFDHFFGLDDESFFEIRRILRVLFGISIGESFKMYSGNGIIFSLRITDLNVIELIETFEDI